MFQTRMDKKHVMEGEKSEQGILVNKLTGTATMVTDLYLLIDKADIAPKDNVMTRSPSDFE
ncbi:hypothetical protein [Peribacillus huizhouensis]|uniref:Uncharacterized protein n=1 Tax=Peribacillus huizhouensis TaxID=1501239 RepID=A0ABR6CTS3_9BACI|nr:hypothetical protein [Peribacillus huizhouensis]MBA9028316.1 hypothetical protein [Peribacillus huizhouensis]